MENLSTMDLIDDLFSYFSELYDGDRERLWKQANRTLAEIQRRVRCSQSD